MGILGLERHLREDFFGIEPIKRCDGLDVQESVPCSEEEFGLR